MATINRFTLVQLAASSVDGKPTVVQWNPAAYEEPSLVSGHIILGVAMTDSDYEQPVAVMKRGFLRDVARQNSETWANGEILYGKSDGTITHTRPAGPLPQIIVGTVFDTVDVLHVIDVDVRVLPSIAELSGVTRETLANLDVLIYNGTTHAWVPRQIDHGGDIAGLLDDDHTQYLKERLSGGAESEVPGHSHQATASAGQLDHGLANTAASLLDNDHPLYQRKHGFEVAADGSALLTITYDKATRKVTLTPTGATFRFWVDGVQFIKTGAQVSGAHAATTGKHFYYYDAAGALQVSTTVWGIRDRTVTPVALVYWDNTQTDGWCFYECHTADRTLEQHYHDHFTEGTKFISGGALTGYTLTTDTDAGVTFAIASTVVADEDIVRTLAAVADNGPYMTLWRTGASGDWTFNDTRTVPYEVISLYCAYNNPNAGGAGVWGLSSAGAGNFAPWFLCCSTSVQGARQFFMVPPQAATGTLVQAQAYTINNLAWGTLPFEEFVPLYRIIFRTGASYSSTGRARIEQIDSISSSVTATLPGAPATHNALSGRDVASTHPASSIDFTPYSTLAATDVQTAIQELLDEAGSPATLDSIGDVNAPTPGNGEVLTWDSTPGEWVSAALPATPSALADLTDVDLTGLVSGDGLYWNPVSGFWEPAGAPPPGVHAFTHESSGSDELALDKLAVPTDNTDLDASTTAHGLCPKGSGVAGEFLKSDLSWGAPATAAALDDLSDVNAPSPGVGEVLTWDGADWVPDTASATVATLDSIGDCNVPAPNDGDVLTWNVSAGEWIASAPSGGPGGGLTGVKWAEIDFEASDSPAQIVALVSAKKIRVHQIVFTVSYDCTVKFLSNATEIVSPMAFPGLGGLNVDRGADGWFMETASGEAFKMTMTANTAPCYCRGSICYTEVDP